MIDAPSETTEVSALKKPKFNLTSTSVCYCWQGHRRVSLDCTTCRRFSNLAKLHPAGGAHHGN
jgi:hypothetical protein